MRTFILAALAVLLFAAPGRAAVYYQSFEWEDASCSGKHFFVPCQLEQSMS
jgi:hypothetical protein